VDQKGFFALHDDERSHLMYGVMFWLYRIATNEMVTWNFSVCSFDFTCHGLPAAGAVANLLDVRDWHLGRYSHVDLYGERRKVRAAMENGSKLLMEGQS